MLGDGAPLPVTAETPARILRTVEKENSYGGRRLSSATISKGGVTVRGKGVLEVLDGGSLEIVTGDLIFAAGMIKAEMLKDHLFPEVFTAPRRTLTTLNGATREHWSTPQTLITATAPPWATSGVVFAVVSELLVVDNREYAPRFTASLATHVADNRGVQRQFDTNDPGITFINMKFYGQSMNGHFVTIPESRAVNIGYVHQVDNAPHIVLSRSWVEMQALIIWI